MIRNWTLRKDETPLCGVSRNEERQASRSRTAHDLQSCAIKGTPYAVTIREMPEDAPGCRTDPETPRNVVPYYMEAIPSTGIRAMPSAEKKEKAAYPDEARMLYARIKTGESRLRNGAALRGRADGTRWQEYRNVRRLA